MESTGCKARRLRFAMGKMRLVLLLLDGEPFGNFQEVI